MWQVEFHRPISDAALCEMFEWRAAGYFHAANIGGSAISKRKGPKRHFVTENRYRDNYAALDYTHRLGAIGNENGEVDGISIECGEVRLEDGCAQTLQKHRPDQCHAKTVRRQIGIRK